MTITFAARELEGIRNNRLNNELNLIQTTLGVTKGEAQALLWWFVEKVFVEHRTDEPAHFYLAEYLTSEERRAILERAGAASAGGNLVRTLDDGTFVEKYRILGTQEWVYRALRPTDGGSFRGYSSFATTCGICCGYVGTELLPADLDALPAYSRERSDAVDRWHHERYQDAYEAIHKAFPESTGGVHRSGEITLLGC